MKKYTYVLLLLSLIYCSKETETKSKIAKKDSTLIIPNNSLKTSNSTFEQRTLSKEEIIQTLNNEILSTFKSKDYVKLANYIHPEKGVQFSMYAYINPKKDKQFSKEDFQKYVTTNIKFTWGEKDGTGDPLVLSLKNYIEEWIFRKDFSKGEYHLSSFKASGNSMNNLRNIYPKLDFTENYIPGSEKYGGMDWNSLRFVFDQYQGQFYLVAIVNDSWTI
jgi:hypothetical protein